MSNVVVQNVENTVFAEARLYGTLNNADDVPFAAAQKLTHSHTMELVELQGPESRTAIGVGVKGETITLSTDFGVMDPKQVQLARGVTPTLVEAVDDPTDACVPTGAGTDGTFEVGYAAVGYAYRRADGTTLVGGIATVQLEATEHIALAAVTPLPTDVESVDWYVSRAVAVSAELAAALPLYFSVNNDGSALNILAPPAAGAHAVPSVSTVGTDMTKVTVGSGDSIRAFDLKMEGSLDGSNIKRIYHNCVVTKMGDDINGPREWVMGSFELKCYGKANASGGYDYYTTLYSGDRA